MSNTKLGQALIKVCEEALEHHRKENGVEKKYAVSTITDSGLTTGTKYEIVDTNDKSQILIKTDDGVLRWFHKRNFTIG